MHSSTKQAVIQVPCHSFMHTCTYTYIGSIITGLVKLCHSQSNQIRRFSQRWLTSVTENFIDFQLDNLNKESDDQLTSYTIMGNFLAITLAITTCVGCMV